MNELVDKCEQELKEEFKKIDQICEFNSKKVLNAFNNNSVSESHFVHVLLVFEHSVQFVISLHNLHSFPSG